MGIITIIGAGNVGQTIAGHMSLLGHTVRMFSRWNDEFQPIRDRGGIELFGEINGTAMPDSLTSDLVKAVENADVVVIAAPAFAHPSISASLAPVLEPDQLVVFQPTVLGSGVELSRQFLLNDREPCLIAESGTSLYTCRLKEPAKVYVGAVKDSIQISAIPSSRSQEVIDRLVPFFGEHYIPAADSLSVGLSNSNPIYHVPPAVLNFKTVEDAERLPQHSLVTPRIGEAIDALDKERLALAAALHTETTSFWQFLDDAYGVNEGSFVERVIQGYGRQSFPEPDSVKHRYFTEDIPFGLVIWSSLAKQLGLAMPLTDGFIAISNVLCGTDFYQDGRTADALGLKDGSVDDIVDVFRNGVR
ncbi:NAD/NADP octopine/nopaline dehydrogenase family protein [Brevibacterium aurantiacum]|uniref:Opine dehydrogenase n=1 Tax=Brevibacterium aurantiacum TaxID=273384 RepID=A0A2A3ZKB5_BREAU|nr:NAD/NADP-dependent octopine/nopaline dehydrogenase family protein [Brevibacterium aurantiacum]AZL08034.1 hypothetical protein CXR26_01365 [Brevibacterium aurantiacum]PCC48142.1 hypothetical protein CIK64_00060 [Brevibacterium aurantiacum]PCC51998.1 hypothetical protein CIK62_00775 [Brevibacterium aurantiacum]SMX92544.1 opine dehydrogenase [Brevibacterium aurantiacum]GEB24215.1 hypothetical protein BAU01nite_29480 [Brevibacterium aurantiacum]